MCVITSKKGLEEEGCPPGAVWSPLRAAQLQERAQSEDAVLASSAAQDFSAPVHQVFGFSCFISPFHDLS